MPADPIFADYFRQIFDYGPNSRREAKLLRFIRRTGIRIETDRHTGRTWLAWGTVTANFDRRRKAVEWCEFVRGQTTG